LFARRFLRTSLSLLALALAAYSLALAGSSGDPGAHSGKKPEVALTFDDLPAHGPLPQGLTRVDIIKSILQSLQAAHAPAVYGFVNAKRMEENPADMEVLKLWRAAGFPLGNHTFSHMDLDKNSVEAFEQDLLAGESSLRELMGDQDWHWFRFPFLNEGETAEKHHAIEAFLKEHGYRVAEVSLSFADYAYNEPYARCLAKNDQAGIAELKQSYLKGAAESLEEGPRISRQLYGRDIKHVMLLHVGGFQTIMLPGLLDLLKQRHYKLIPLPAAAADPVYAADPDLSSNWDNLFLQQVMRARHLPLPTSDDPSAKLGALCK
jgi:peptidoglycan-N-acetylglucosamine deacetylase